MFLSKVPLKFPSCLQAAITSKRVLNFPRTRDYLKGQNFRQDIISADKIFGYSSQTFGSFVQRFLKNSAIWSGSFFINFKFFVIQTEVIQKNNIHNLE